MLARATLYNNTSSSSIALIMSLPDCWRFRQELEVDVANQAIVTPARNDTRTMAMTLPCFFNIPIVTPNATKSPRPVLTRLSLLGRQVHYLYATEALTVFCRHFRNSVSLLVSLKGRSPSCSSKSNTPC